MEALAGREPCPVPKADMFRLIELTGFDRTDLAWTQIEGSSDPVLVLRDGVLQMVAMARE